MKAVSEKAGIDDFGMRNVPPTAAEDLLFAASCLSEPVCPRR
jgi:hypothetical protein